ncbi:MAG: YdcF family protein [Acidimicrobiaceae bacterium]|nr:YdcF family protein [Acidimicrobiaceae bacterium]
MFGLIFGPVRLVFKIVGIIFSLIVLYFAFTFVQIWLTGRTHSTANAQAILVFGTTENNGTPSQELQARLNEALIVYRAGRAPWIAVTGGNRPGDVYTEAGVSATYLEAHGVPKSRIIVGGGDDTWQNVESVAPQLKAHGLYSVITVTDPFHEFRAMANASSQGLSPIPSPVENSPTIKHSLWRYYLKETLAVGVGRLIGFGQLSSWTTANHISIPFGG